jgi:glyoxylase-like metal-dependent hydrolase (beta-lactamase superfamily II)
MTNIALDFHLLKVGHCSHPECIAERGGRLASVRFPALVGLLIHPERGPMLFDTGYSDAFFQATRTFPERLYRWVTPVSLATNETLAVQLAQRGYSVGDIRHLFISHLHADHVAGLIDFPHAQIFAMRAEVRSMLRRSRIGALRRGFLRGLLPTDFEGRLHFIEDMTRASLPASMRPFTEGFDLLGDGSVIGVALPGHTEGQMGVLFRTRDERNVFLVADSCWSLAALRDDRPPTWIASQLFADKHAYLSTFAGLRELLGTRSDLLIVPSHCESTWKQVSHEAR